MPRQWLSSRSSPQSGATPQLSKSRARTDKRRHLRSTSAPPPCRTQCGSAAQQRGAAHVQESAASNRHASQQTQQRSEQRTAAAAPAHAGNVRPVSKQQHAPQPSCAGTAPIGVAQQRTRGARGDRTCRNALPRVISSGTQRTRKMQELAARAAAHEAAARRQALQQARAERSAGAQSTAATARHQHARAGTQDGSAAAQQHNAQPAPASAQAQRLCSRKPRAPTRRTKARTPTRRAGRAPARVTRCHPRKVRKPLTTKRYFMHMTLSSAPLVSLIAGILILMVPRLLNYMWLFI